MSVHYKFKSTKDYDTLTFDGLHISLRDLKKSIFQQKNLGKNTDFDLLVKNAQTDEVYDDENTLIPKNTSLIVHRVPLSAQAKRANTRQALNPHLLPATKDQLFQDGESGGGFIHSSQVDLARMEGSEDDKISAMMSQSTQDYDPSNYQRIRNNQTGPVNSNFRCYRCHSVGQHWIKDCPLKDAHEVVDIKKSTGIPRSFMVPVEGPSVPGAMMTPTGHFAVPAIDHQAYKEGKKERPPFASQPVAEPEKPEIPEDLLCCVCKDLLTDAVMMPCCGNSFCDDCIRSVLLESEDQECPVCHEKEKTPEMLIPNRFLRKRVADFGDQTGYRKPHKTQPPPVQRPPEQERSPAHPAEPAADPVTNSAAVVPSSQNEGETSEQRPSPPPSPFIQPPISTGSGIPVLGAPIKPPSHHSDVTKKHSDDSGPPSRTESHHSEQKGDYEKQDFPKQDYKRDRLKQDRHHRDRAYDRKRHREREVDDARERELEPPRPRRSPHHNQPSSHPTGPPGDNDHNNRDVSRLGYLHEDRPGTPTIDERTLDTGASMHHAQGGLHPPPLHYADMSVPPPVVQQHYSHQAYGRPQGGSAYSQQRGLEDGSGYSQPVSVPQHMYIAPSSSLPPPSAPGPAGGYYDDRTMAYGLPPHDPAYRDNYDRGPARYPPHNGSQTGHNLDPLEEFERRMRIKEEHEKRRDLLRQRSPRSRSYTRSRSRSRSRPLRSPRSRTPLSRTRSRSRTPRRSLSRTPPLKSRKFTRSRSRTPRRSWSRSISRTRRTLTPRRSRSRTPPPRKRSRTRTRTRSRSRSRSPSFSLSRSRSRSLSPRERRPLSPRPRRDIHDRDGPRHFRSRSRSPVPRYSRGYPKDAAPYYDAEPGYARGRGGRGRGRGRSAGGGPGGPGLLPPSYRKEYDLAPRDSYRYPAEGSGPIPYGHPPHSSSLRLECGSLKTALAELEDIGSRAIRGLISNWFGNINARHIYEKPQDYSSMIHLLPPSIYIEDSFSLFVMSSISYYT